MLPIDSLGTDKDVPASWDELEERMVLYGKRMN